MWTWIWFQAAKLLVTYLIVRLILEFVRILDELVRLVSKIIRLRLRRVCYHVYPNARFRFNPLETCVICLGQRTNSVLQCGHAYHWECVQTWLEAQNTCPVCRTWQRRIVEMRME